MDIEETLENCMIVIIGKNQEHLEKLRMMSQQMKSQQILVFYN